MPPFYLPPRHSLYHYYLQNRYFRRRHFADASARHAIFFRRCCFRFRRRQLISHMMLPPSPFDARRFAARQLPASMLPISLLPGLRFSAFHARHCR
jgi:hypothetical protein